MRFQSIAPVFIQGVYHPGNNQDPIIIVLPKGSKHVSMEWDPLDKEAQTAQFEMGRAKGMIKDARKMNKDKELEAFEDWDRRNQFRPFREGWTGKDIITPREGAAVFDPKKEEAPLAQGIEKNEKLQPGLNPINA